MTFYADLHIHSKYSRATSRDADLEHFALWARKKGLSVVGTGDFTHPAWLSELKQKLVPAEPGLFRLRDDLQLQAEHALPASCRGTVRFILEVEISTIYKKGGKTRKIHHIILAPGFEQADRIVQKLSRIGNIKSDGRPILGLDSKDLLEITLEAGEGCFLVPAHIWTPWFSVFGSKSGFDSLDECYGDLTSHVFALETGLSSDPPMNWRLSSLDRCRLVSNSDAHSPSKLGREACVFDAEMNYFGMLEALRTGRGYAGTVEFFPEEGKYHLDGHRKCNVKLTPEETRQNRSICPICGKPLTVGVMSRVAELADRPVGAAPVGAPPFRSFVPLAEIMSEILGVGATSNKVQNTYESLISAIGPELFVLEHAAPDDIERKASPMLAEAVRRMRAGQVIREAGYDGEYGVIRLFTPDELANKKR
jgi:DNA helicase II / ATP-dependent DNA helicase PcrA